MNNTKRVHMLMHKENIKKLDKIADLTFESRSTVIRQAVNKYINEFDFVKVNNNE